MGVGSLVIFTVGGLGLAHPGGRRARVAAGGLRGHAGRHRPVRDGHREPAPVRAWTRTPRRRSRPSSRRWRTAGGTSRAWPSTSPSTRPWTRSSPARQPPRPVPAPQPPTTPAPAPSSRSAVEAPARCSPSHACPPPSSSRAPGWACSGGAGAGRRAAGVRPPGWRQDAPSHHRTRTGRPRCQGVDVEEHLGSRCRWRRASWTNRHARCRLGGGVAQDKPALLTLVYYNCPMLCNLVINDQVAAPCGSWGWSWARTTRRSR